MKPLHKNQWIAVAVALVVIGAFVYLFMMPASSVQKTTTMNTTNPANTSAKVATKGSLVSVNYTGKFADGTVFDTSAGRAPIQFILGTGQVIAGWDEGIVGMKVGEKKHLVIPSEKAYGAQGYPPVIPPNATLYFDVELVDVQNQ